MKLLVQLGDYNSGRAVCGYFDYEVLVSGQSFGFVERLVSAADAGAEFTVREKLRGIGVLVCHD